MGFRGQFAQQQSETAHVRFGSKADMAARLSDVRFGSKADIGAAGFAGGASTAGVPHA